MSTLITTTGQTSILGNPVYQYFTMNFSIGGALSSAGGTVYAYPDYAIEQAAENIGQVVPVACTLVSSYGHMKTAPGDSAGDTVVVKVRQDKADTTNTFTIAGAAVSGNDVTHTVNFSAGNLATISVVGTTDGGWTGADLSVTLLFRYTLI